MAAQAIRLTGETTVLDGDTLLALGIQFAGRQLGFQCLDDGREDCLQPVYCLFLPIRQSMRPGLTESADDDAPG